MRGLLAYDFVGVDTSGKHGDIYRTAIPLDSLHVDTAIVEVFATSCSPFGRAYNFNVTMNRNRFTAGRFAKVPHSEIESKCRYSAAALLSILQLMMSEASIIFPTIHEFSDSSTRFLPRPMPEILATNCSPLISTMHQENELSLIDYHKLDELYTT